MPGLGFRYVGSDRLPMRLSEFDVERYFALTDSDVAVLNERFRTDRRAGAAIQLVFLRASGHRRTHAVGIYTHVLDQHGIVYNQPIVLNERQAGVAIEGAVRHSDTREDGGLLALAVDTHINTNVGMAVSKLLGFDLCPRLRNLSERKLYLPRGMEIAKDLAPIVDHGISLKPIRDGWDGLLRLVASIKSGRVSAVVALQRFGSAAQGDPIYRAAEQFGKRAAHAVPVRLFQQRRVSPRTTCTTQSR